MYQNFIIPHLCETQHVSGDTPPIIRILKLHWQPLIFHTWKVVGRVAGRRCQAQCAWQRPSFFMNCTMIHEHQVYNTSRLLQYACACYGSLIAVHINACEWQYIPTKSIHAYKQSLASDTDFEARHMISIQHVSKLDTKWMTQSSQWVCHTYRQVTYEAQRHGVGVGNKGRTCVALMKPYHSYCKLDYWTNWNIDVWIRQTLRGTETTQSTMDRNVLKDLSTSNILKSEHAIQTQYRLLSVSPVN
jgi:hypothetical protein